MELDGYNAAFKVAFEHHGTQHYRETKFYKAAKFTKRQVDDISKATQCAKRGVRLFVVRELFKTTSLDQLRQDIITFASETDLPLIENAASVVIDINSLYAADPIDRLREYCAGRGGTFASPRWEGAAAKYSVVCGLGHAWKAAAEKLLSGQWCPICKWDTIRAANTIHTIEEMHQTATARGGACESAVYANFMSPLQWRCAEGHRWLAPASNVVHSGKWCRICARKKTADGQRGTLAQCQEMARLRGYRCLSTNYVNARTKMLWECAAGHTRETTADTFRTSHGCRKCRSTYSKTAQGALAP